MGPIGFLRLLQMAGFECQEKINTGNLTAGERRGLGRVGAGRGGLRQLRSHVNTNTNLREQKRIVHCSRKRMFHIMKNKNEGIRILFPKEESQSESGTTWAAHRIICNIIPHHKEGKTTLILYSNKNMK